MNDASMKPLRARDRLTAKALGLTIPRSLLFRADAIIK